MRVLFLENDDSFSWNVIDALPVSREQLHVHRVRRQGLDLGLLAACDVLVIGPGPTDPLRAGLVELVRAAATRGLPTLGICLGHQAIGLAFGAQLTRVPPAHGKVDVARFEPSRCFPSFVGPLRVMRYHSLAIESVQSPLRVVARTQDGIAMAIEHEALPIAGVQFHPDSYATQRGPELLAAFFQSLSLEAHGPARAGA